MLVSGPPDPGRFAYLAATWTPDREDVLEVRIPHRVADRVEDVPAGHRVPWLPLEHVPAVRSGVEQAQAAGCLTTGTLSVHTAMAHDAESNWRAFGSVALTLVWLLWSMGAADNDWDPTPEPMPRQFWPPLKP